MIQFHCHNNKSKLNQIKIKAQKSTNSFHLSHYQENSIFILINCAEINKQRDHLQKCRTRKFFNIEDLAKAKVRINKIKVIIEKANK